MAPDLITRYKQSIWLRFDNADAEEDYRARKLRLDSPATLVMFGSLAILALVFAFLEFRAFGHEVAIPMYVYLGAATYAMLNCVLGQLNVLRDFLQLRLQIGLILVCGGIIAAVYLQKYGAYHALEFALVVLWLGSVGVFRTGTIAGISAILASSFVVAMYFAGSSEFWLTLVSIILMTIVFLAVGISYLVERNLRMLYLRKQTNDSVTIRQELWAFTLIDLDLSLSGVLNSEELIGLLIKHLRPVVKFEAYAIKILEGRNAESSANKLEDKLFEDGSPTVWSEALCNKLEQTRQAVSSAEHGQTRGWFGVKQQRFISYRLDVPVLNASRLFAVISFRRADEPFDNLDTIASVSIAAQAMLIYRRSKRMPPVAADVSPRGHSDISADVNTSTWSRRGMGNVADSQDIEVTDSSFNSDVALAASGLRSQSRQDGAAAKRTVTLMSRENAEKVAVDRYRTAIIEGDPLSILLIEVDGLSALRENDGDQIAYRVFASVVRFIFTKLNRDRDVVGRYGQNGLSIVMPDIDMNAAEKFAESLRLHVAATRYKTASGERTATLSIGVAAVTDETGDYAAMVRRADMALFMAKKNGHNCVRVRL